MKTGVILGLFVTLISYLSIVPTTFGQTEKLGMVEYTPPKDWTKKETENVVVFSKINSATGGYCFITLYGATPGTGNPEKDFAREWKNLVVKPFGAQDNPKTETEAADGWTGIAGGSAIDFQGSKSTAFLTVFSRGEITVSVLGITNDETFLPQLVAFVSGIKEDKTATPTAENPPTQPERSSPPTPSTNTTAIHQSTLVKEFENNEIRANQLYVGKRMRIYGTVNSIEIDRQDRIVLTFKSAISTNNMTRCFFNKSQQSRLANVNAHVEATVEGTIRGLGGGFDNSKMFLILEDCVIP